MNNFYPALQAGFGGYHSPSPSLDQYRSQNLVNGSPIQPPVTAQMPAMVNNQGAFGAPGFGMPMGMNSFGYGGMNGMQQNVPYMQEQGNNRRGRVGYSPQAGSHQH
jgi:protein JSN1